MRSHRSLALCGVLTLWTPCLVHAQAPVAGQPYQIPAGLESEEAGTTVAYGGANYVIQDDGTMLLDEQQTVVETTTAGPVAGQPYQVPAGFESYGAGTLISYGGANYVIQADGTMLLAQQQTVTETTTAGPVAGQPYQVPAGFESYGAGTLISYGGANYVIQADGTMLLAQQQTVVETTSAGPIAGQPYQVPAGFESYGAGTLISYGGANYVIQGDGTMLLAQQMVESPSTPAFSFAQPEQDQGSPSRPRFGSLFRWANVR